MPTELLPQPPPGVPAPPPGEVALRARWRFLLILGLGVGSILVVVAIAATFISHTLAKRRNADLATATGNLRSLSSALIEFDSQYSTYPDAATAVVIKESTNSSWIFSDSTSNDLLRQLLAVGILPSEEQLYAKTPRAKKPDNRFSSDTEALAAGECALSYIPGSTARSDPDTPVCLVPLEPGKLTFDREVFDGQAVILCADSRVVVLPIDKHGHAILNGMDLFDPRQPFWHGKAPNVKWPK
jgi:hypothetical protein